MDDEFYNNNLSHLIRAYTNRYDLDFRNKVIIGNKKGKEYIAKWDVPDLEQPTEEQLKSVKVEDLERFKRIKQNKNSLLKVKCLSFDEINELGDDLECSLVFDSSNNQLKIFHNGSWNII